MSRSRKKVSGYVDRNPWYKNYANRQIRRIPVSLDGEADPIGNHGNYRRYSDSWNICDFRVLFLSYHEFCERESDLANIDDPEEFQKHARAKYNKYLRK